MLQNLAYELSVLTKAVQHKNLSAASIHVGLSQPQLSRLIAKIESELNVVLLDRSARRKSGWTNVAIDLALIFNKGLHRLESEILSIVQEREMSELRIGTLEGLSSIAVQFAQACFEKMKMRVIFLDILDFKDLDSQFLSGGLDLIFTVKAPSKQKFNHQIEVGFQQMEKVNSDTNIYVCSPFELTTDKKIENDFKHLFVSNSLHLRRQWLNEFGGTGTLPTETKKGRGKGFYSVYLYGSDLISPGLWQQITSLAID
jgi:LysR family transcriptional regulator, transcriptional activator for aaeXAB operon